MNANQLLCVCVSVFVVCVLCECVSVLSVCIAVAVDDEQKETSVPGFIWFVGLLGRLYDLHHLRQITQHGKH